MKQPVDKFLKKQKYSLYTQMSTEAMLTIAVNALYTIRYSIHGTNITVDELANISYAALEKINAIASEALE